MRLRALIAVLALLPALAFADYQSTILADSPLPAHWWRLDDTSGTTAVDSGAVGANDGSFVGGYTLNQAGILGNSARPSVALNGSTGYVNVGGNQANLPIQTVTARGTSIELWVKPTACSTGTAQSLFANQAVGGYNYDIRLRDSTTDFVVVVWDSGCAGNNYGVALGGTCTTSAWHQAVMTAHTSGNAILDRLKLYVDGSLVSTVTSFGGSGAFCSNSLATNIGRESTSAQYYGGLVDEVLLYRDTNAANTGNELSAAQVLAHYNAGFTAAAAGARRRVISSKLELPRFRDDDYFERVSALGYNTGLLGPNVREPLLLRAAFTAPFSVMPNGRGKSARPQKWNGTPFERRARELGLLKKAA